MEAVFDDGGFNLDEIELLRVQMEADEQHLARQISKFDMLHAQSEFLARERQVLCLLPQVIALNTCM